MEKNVVPKPKVTHTNIRPELKKLARVLDEFKKQVLNCGEELLTKNVHGKMREWYKHTSIEDLKDLRKHLVSQVKKGMLERKDQEVEIALAAMMVWFIRLESDKQNSILEMW
jgi:hypothetical protein